ncbi:hypothetical protein FNH08_35965, partial [Streptomyces spongiae]|nr:hypothetical protein [Streptomyces spongiae]
PQLLYAGEVGSARVVLLYDGLRVARYAEPKESTGGAALDFARVDGATGAGASALVLDRVDGNVRYLTAPWVTKVAVRDLMKPDGGTSKLPVSADGVTGVFASPALRPGTCRSWNVLQLNDADGARLLTDLAELTPAHLTSGRPSAPREASKSLGAWSPYACSLAAARAQGVRSVNAWRYARQSLPDWAGTATWVCTRAETWRGGGTRVLAQFRAPGDRYGAVAAKADDSPACGARDPHLLAGVLWKSGAGTWYLLAAGSRDTTSVTATGKFSGSAQSNVLAVRARQGARADLKGTLTNGRSITGLR